ncbi:MAG: extracellular matrix regulator RemB [Eubacterium sp.]
MGINMYLHLGEDTIIRDKDIIGIFDIDTSTVNKATRDYLAKAEKEKRVKYVNYDLPKSFIVTDKKVFVSPINTSTLNKRAKI